MKVLPEALAAIAVALAVATVAIPYSTLPQRIPSHFNAAGVVNGWGDKSLLWVVVGVCCLLYVSLTLLRLIPPRLFNVPVRSDQRARAIPTALEMISWIKAEMAAIFAVIVWSIVAVAKGRSRGLSAWFTPAELLLVLGTVAFYIRRMFALSAEGPS